MNRRISDRPVLLAVTGASGSMYALKFLEMMNDLGQDVHLVISDTGLDVCRLELGVRGLDRLRGLAAKTNPTLSRLTINGLYTI